jgi:hypothetical protein
VLEVLVLEWVNREGSAEGVEQNQLQPGRRLVNQRGNNTQLSVTTSFRVFSVVGVDVLQYSIGAVVVTEMVAKDAGSSADITENSGEGERRSSETQI